MLTGMTGVLEELMRSADSADSKSILIFQDFFEILYADASAARAFHREVDRDENTKVGISFLAKLPIPHQTLSTGHGKVARDWMPWS